MVLAHKGYRGSVAVARMMNISLRQLYYWVNVLKIVRPKYHRYGKREFARFNVSDIARLRAMKTKLALGFTHTAAARAVRRAH